MRAQSDRALRRNARDNGSAIFFRGRFRQSVTDGGMKTGFNGPVSSSSKDIEIEIQYL